MIDLTPYQKSVLIAFLSAAHGEADVKQIATFLRETGWVDSSVEENTILKTLGELRSMGLVEKSDSDLR